MLSLRKSTGVEVEGEESQLNLVRTDGLVGMNVSF